VLPPGESQWVCVARPISVRKKTPRALLRFEKMWDGQTDGRTDGRQTDVLRLRPDAVSVIIRSSFRCFRSDISPLQSCMSYLLSTTVVVQVGQSVPLCVCLCVRTITFTAATHTFYPQLEWAVPAFILPAVEHHCTLAGNYFPSRRG